MRAGGSDETSTLTTRKSQPVTGEVNAQKNTEVGNATWKDKERNSRGWDPRGTHEESVSQCQQQAEEEVCSANREARRQQPDRQQVMGEVIQRTRNGRTSRTRTSTHRTTAVAKVVMDLVNR